MPNNYIICESLSIYSIIDSTHRVTVKYNSATNRGHLSSASEEDPRDQDRITTDIMSHDSAEDGGYYSKGEYNMLKPIEESEEISFTNSTVRHDSEDKLIIPTKGQADDEMDNVKLI